MSRTNETRYIEWHETCKCECKFGENFCNNKQRWNKNKCRYECKELIDKRVCDKGFIWNPSNYECECDKACDIGEYLDIKIVNTVHIVLMVVTFTIFVEISTYFVYYNWSLIKNNVSYIKFGIHKETKIW